MLAMTKEEIDEDIPLCLQLIDELVELNRNYDVSILRKLLQNFDSFYETYTKIPEEFMKMFTFDDTDVDLGLLCSNPNLSEMSIKIMYFCHTEKGYDEDNSTYSQTNTLFKMPIKIHFSDYLRCQLDVVKAHAERFEIIYRYKQEAVLENKEAFVRKELLKKSFKNRGEKLLKEVRKRMLIGECPITTLSFKFLDNEISFTIQSCFLIDDYFNNEMKNRMSDSDESTLFVNCSYTEELFRNLVSWFTSGYMKSNVSADEIQALKETADMYMMEDLQLSLRHLENLGSSLKFDFGVTMEVEELVGDYCMLKFYSINDDSSLYILSEKDDDNKYKLSYGNSTEFLYKMFDNLSNYPGGITKREIKRYKLMNFDSYKEMKRRIRRIQKVYSDKKKDYTAMTPAAFYKEQGELKVAVGNKLFEKFMDKLEPDRPKKKKLYTGSDSERSNSDDSSNSYESNHIRKSRKGGRKIINSDSELSSDEDNSSEDEELSKHRKNRTRKGK